MLNIMHVCFIFTAVRHLADKKYPIMVVENIIMICASYFLPNSFDSWRAVAYDFALLQLQLEQNFSKVMEFDIPY